MNLSTMLLGAVQIETATIHVPAVGVWFADLTLLDGELPTGAQTMQIGDQSFVGTVDPAHSGTFGARTKARLVGGAGSWGRVLPPKSYPNDAGVKPLLVAADAAREAGERLETTPLNGAPRLGVAYARESGPAVRTLEDAIRKGPWRVDFDGVTRVGPRAAAPIGDHLLIDWDPQSRIAVLACDSLKAVPIGAVIPASIVLPQAVTIQSLEIKVTSEGLRVHAWCGEGRETSLLATLRALVERLVNQRLLGAYHYRVVQMNGDRCDLQPVSSASGLPKLVTVSMWPGVSGIHCRLTRGTEVAVQFLDGDRSKPIVSSFVGRGGPGDIPESIEIGGPGGSGAARQNDTVEVLLPPAIITGTMVIAGTPSPFTGVMSYTIPKTLGTISTCSAITKIK